MIFFIHVLIVFLVNQSCFVKYLSLHPNAHTCLWNTYKTYTISEFQKYQKIKQFSIPRSKQSDASLAGPKQGPARWHHSWSRSTGRRKSQAQTNKMYVALSHITDEDPGSIDGHKKRQLMFKSGENPHKWQRRQINHTPSNQVQKPKKWVWWQLMKVEKSWKLIGYHWVHSLAVFVHIPLLFDLFDWSLIPCNIFVGE